MVALGYCGDAIGSGQGYRSIADRTAAIFLSIARRSTNGEHQGAVDRLNARLHAVRTVEPHVIERTDEELAAWTSTAAGGEREFLRPLIAVYHRRRRRAAADTVRTAYRTS
jgi:hypothetical protein